PITFIRMIVITRTMIAVQIHLNRHHCPANPAAIPVSNTSTRKGYITRVDSVESTTSERMESGDVSRRRRNPIAAAAPWARTKPTTEVTCRKTSQAYGMSSADYAAAAGRVDTSRSTYRAILQAPRRVDRKSGVEGK